MKQKLSCADIPDKTLVARAKRGNAEAFAVLHGRHRQQIFSVCYSVIHDETVVEDLVQETFMKAYRGLKRFRSESTFSTWLCRIAINEAIMILRKKRYPHVSIDDFIETEEGDMGFPELSVVDSSLVTVPIRLQLVKAIGRLSPIHRDAFIMHDVHGMQHSEIAKALQISMGNTKSRIRRARLKLREHLPGFRG